MVCHAAMKNAVKDSVYPTEIRHFCGPVSVLIRSTQPVFCDCEYERALRLIIAELKGLHRLVKEDVAGSLGKGCGSKLAKGNQEARAKSVKRSLSRLIS